MTDVHAREMLNLLIQNVEDYHHIRNTPPELRSQQWIDQSKRCCRLDTLLAAGLIDRNWPHFGGVLPKESVYTFEGKQLHTSYFKYKAKYNLMNVHVDSPEAELIIAMVAELLYDLEYFVLDTRRPGLKVFFYNFSQSNLVVDAATFEPSYCFSTQYLITDPTTPKLIPDTSLRDTLASLGLMRL